MSLSIVFIAPAATAAAGGGCHPDNVASTDGSGTTVDISKCRMNPTILRIESGTIVTFENNDEHQLMHNVYGLNWGTEQLNAGGSYQHRFDAIGIHPYACTLHPGMVAAVVVGEAAAGAAGPAVGGNSGGGSNGVVIASVAGVLTVGAVAAIAAGLGIRRRSAAPPLITSP